MISMNVPGKPKKSAHSPGLSTSLLKDVRTLIDAAQSRVAQAVNAELVLLYWHIGARIRHDILLEARAEYGEKIVSTLSRQLTTSYGPGFSRQNLFHMIRFAEAWPDHEQVTRLATNVGWSHCRSGRNWPLSIVSPLLPPTPMLADFSAPTMSGMA